MPHSKNKLIYQEIPKLISSKSLIKAIKNNNFVGTKFLLKHNISPNESHFSTIFNSEKILHFAIRKENIQIVKLLLLYGADPNCEDSFGITPLHRSALHNYTLTKILLENGALVNVKSLYGYTPLHLAVGGPLNKNSIDNIKLLLQYDADLNAKVNTKAIMPYIDEGKTPIKLVCSKAKNLKVLLELEQLYRSKKLHKIVEKPYIKEAHIQDFIKWKAEAEIPKFIKSDSYLLSQYLQKLFALNKFLQKNSFLVSSDITKLLEEKIQNYTGNQDLNETKQPILTLKYFATLKIVQNFEECSKYFPEILPASTIEMIETLEQEYGINLSGISEDK